MFLEAAESAGVVAAQLSQNAAQLATLGASLRASPPRAVVTCARGSSDHAATYARYLIEAHTQALTSSAAPSLSSVYDASTDMRDVLFIAISQSGRSPDLLAATGNARRGGARTIAICNSPEAPLMRAVDVAIPLHAGLRGRARLARGGSWLSGRTWDGLFRVYSGRRRSATSRTSGLASYAVMRSEGKPQRRPATTLDGASLTARARHLKAA